MITKPEFQFTIYHAGGRGGVHRSFVDFPFGLRYISFEPGDEDAETSREHPGIQTTELLYVKSALGRNHGDQVKLKIYNHKDLASIYDFNHGISNRYKHQNIFLESEIMIPVTTIDLYSQQNNHQVDYMILDTQGSELEILSGASRVLESVIGIRVEINFMALYSESPLFYDVCKFLYDRRMALIMLEKPGSPTVGPATDAGPFSLNWDDAAPFASDAIFIKIGILDSIQEKNLKDVAHEFSKLILFLNLNNANSVALDYIKMAIDMDMFEKLMDHTSQKIAKHICESSLAQLKKLGANEWQSDPYILSKYKKERLELVASLNNYMNKFANDCRD